MKRLESVVLLMITVIAFLLFPVAVTPVFASKIAVFPFKINAEKKMDFLQNGISDIIFARLSTIVHETKHDTYEVVRVDEKKNMTREDVFKISQKEKADFAIVGTVTIFGDNVSTNAFLYDVKSRKTLIVLNKRDDTQNTLFNTIHGFTDTVLMKTRVQGPETMDGVASSKTGLLISDVNDVDNLMSEGMIRSEILSLGVSSLSTGDVNNDGTTDIVFTDDHDIYVAHMKNGTFGVQETIKGKHYHTIIALDIMDTNKNGTPEIIVTTMQKSGITVASYILEWNGKKFERTLTEKGWFLAVRNIDNSGKSTLIGQKQTYGYEIFAPSVFSVGVDQKKKSIETSGRIKLPQTSRIYDFSFGNILNQGKTSLISYAAGGVLVVYDKTMDELWRSSKKFGGSLKYLEARKKDLRKRLYLNPRIIVSDIDSDGLTEVLSIRNRNTAPRALVNLKNFKDGHIACLVWKGYGMATKWKTPVVNGYIPDFSVADIDKDGKKDLVYCVVIKSDGFLKKQKTYFVVQKLSV